ncbi:MAG: hypothetical protein KDK90_27490 [Leptospiraceae bacterium]|nr:hypothetical protein [Leptospiraceae bacterium]
MKKLIIILICFLQIQYLQADSVKNINEGCNPDIKDRGENAFLTFYGDSLGDFVDSGFHGIVGWDAYLGFYRPDFDSLLGWRVQNFAVEGWTTRSIYEGLKKCLYNKDTRANFKMSNTIAMEIGGNDMVNYTPLLIFMPWKYWTYRDPTTNKDVKGVVDVVLHNIKVLIYFFRHPLIDKNVLVMGNFPTLAYSPTLGNVGDYFEIRKAFSDIYYRKWNEKDPNTNVEKDDQKENLDFLQEVTAYAMILTSSALEVMYTANELFGDKLGETLDNLFDTMLPSRIKDKKLDSFKAAHKSSVEWYLEWVYYNSANLTTAASFGLYLMQPGLEALAVEMRDRTRNMKPEITSLDKTQTYTAHNRKGGNYVDFLPLYHLTVRSKDCKEYGYCWVANPILYRDNLPGHINHLGYYLWANSLSQKLAELDSDNDWKHTNVLGFDKPSNTKKDGTIEETPDGFNDPIVPIDENGNEVKPEEPRVDINSLLLLCFFFGSCHF